MQIIDKGITNYIFQMKLNIEIEIYHFNMKILYSNYVVEVFTLQRQEKIENNGRCVASDFNMHSYERC